MTVHEKTRCIGHFGGNEALTEMISMQTAEDRTALSRTDSTLSSLVNLTWQETEQRLHTLYGDCAKLQMAIYA